LPLIALLGLSSIAQVRGPVRISLDEAIQLALQHNHNLLAARTTIQQSQATEITANLRPNPTLFGDWEYFASRLAFASKPGSISRCVYQ
jgi:outer membrane protein TolC